MQHWNEINGFETAAARLAGGPLPFLVAGAFLSILLQLPMGESARRILLWCNLVAIIPSIAAFVFPVILAIMQQDEAAWFPGLMLLTIHGYWGYVLDRLFRQAYRKSAPAGRTTASLT